MQTSSLCSLINTLYCESNSLRNELNSNQDFLNPKPEHQTLSPNMEKKLVQIFLNK